MKVPNLLARLRQSRRLSLIVFAISLLTLIVAAVWFISARSALADAYGRLGNARQLLSEAQVREQEAQLKVQHARSAVALLAQADAQGLQPGAWGERLLNLQQTQLSRQDAATVLEAMGRSGSRITGTQAFELSVTHPDEGLFDVPVQADRMPAPLAVTVRANVMFRTSSLDLGDDAPVINGAAP